MARCTTPSCLRNLSRAKKRSSRSENSTLITPSRMLSSRQGYGGLCRELHCLASRQLRRRSFGLLRSTLLVHQGKKKRRNRVLSSELCSETSSFLCRAPRALLQDLLSYALNRFFLLHLAPRVCFASLVGSAEAMKQGRTPCLVKIAMPGQKRHAWSKSPCLVKIALTRAPCAGWWP